MKKRGLFVVGTDTDAGKTFVTARIGGLLQESPHSIGLLKPVASGAKMDKQGHLYSEDGRELMRLSRIPIELENMVNPIRLLGEYSPKIAARKAGLTLSIEKIKGLIQQCVNSHDYTLIEGAGGITTPFTDTYRLDELLCELSYPVLLVADGRLGSINRVLLSVDYLKQRHIPILGIIINNYEYIPEDLLTTNLEDMKLYTGLPILGVMPTYDGPQDVSCELAWTKKYLQLEKLMQAWEAYDA